MLEKKNRLTKDKEFDNVFKLGRASYSRILGVKLMVNKQDHSRFGILVSTKVSKKAVVRNKIKRQIREIIHSQIKDFKNGNDVIIITLPPIIEADYKKIKDTLNQLFKKLSLFKNA